MKKVLLTVVLALVATTTFAQKGAIWFDGNIAFTNRTVNNEITDTKLGSTDFDINVSGNYMLADQWSLGLGLGYNMQSADYAVDLANKTNMFTVALQGYYFKPLCGKLVWAPRAFFSYGMGTNTTEMAAPLSDIDQDFSAITLGVEPLSFKYVCGQHCALTFAFNFADIYFMSESVKDVSTTNTFHCQLGNVAGLTTGGLGFKLGFAYTL